MIAWWWLIIVGCCSFVLGMAIMSLCAISRLTSYQEEREMKKQCRCYINAKSYARQANKGGDMKGYIPCPIHDKQNIEWVKPELIPLGRAISVGTLTDENGVLCVDCLPGNHTNGGFNCYTGRGVKK